MSHCAQEYPLTVRKADDVLPPVATVYLCDTAFSAVFAVTEMKFKLENVTIANALQLEAARRRAVPICFNFVAGVKFELVLPIRCRYVTL